MGKKGKDKKGDGSKDEPVVTKSFDSELDALFKAAKSTHPSQSKASNGAISKVADVDDSAENSDEGEDEGVMEAEAESKEEGDGELSSIESDAVISGISEDEESENEEAGAIVSTTKEAEANKEVSDDDESEDDGKIPVHETISNPSLLLNNGASSSKLSSKRKAADREEPQAQRDARSLFVGNLPVHLATSKTSMKALRKHLIACSPYPTVTQIDSIRLRSIPFSKPTDDYEARNPDEAEDGQKKRQRSRTYKESLNEKKVFLSGSQKRKVAYINQEINDKADSVNAYLTLSHISSSALEKFQKEQQKGLSRLTAPALAALLATSVNGTLFEERHLRADLVVPLLPADILETGLHTVKTADGSLLGASAGATSIDNESRKRTVFVGNLDFEAKEEELRGFFESLVTRERGSPPDVKVLDFSQSDKLPLEENKDEESEGVVKRLPSWVYGVRIIRDAATQMGKGFGYVRFLDAACVDEIMAIHESEQNALAAIKAGKSSSGDFRRKLKFKGRPLRLSRCKVSKGNVTSSAALSPSKITKTPTPKRAIAELPHRSRSSGAPTPGGSSPFVKRHQHQKNQESPTRPPSKGLSAAVPNPKPLHLDPLKTARNAQKRSDMARQARRMEKKSKKRAERTGLVDQGDKTRVNFKMGKGSKSTKKIGRLGSLAMLSIVALLSILVQSVSANNEIVNFGPILCRADEVGHLEDEAARQVSQGWPVLYSSSKPTLFSINPKSQPDGVWLILSLDKEEDNRGPTSSKDTATSITPESLATKSFPLLTLVDEEKKSPRDRFFDNLKRKLFWNLNHRFSFRVNWAPNFPINVEANVYSPRSMLAKGKITWKAAGQEDDMESYQQEQDLKGVNTIPVWPCPRLYVHIKSTYFGVPIPPQQPLNENSGLFSKILFGAAEAYMGPLMGKRSIAQEEAPIPVHLIFEPLYLAVIPQTALSLLALLVPVLMLAFLFILPPITAAFTSLSNEHHIKSE